MKLELENKVALVTGGAAGIGRAAAIAFATNGAAVALSDLKKERGEEIAHAIGKGGGRAIFVHGDVSRPTDVSRLVDVTVSTFGSLDWKSGYPMSIDGGCVVQ